MNERKDVYARVTETIVAALEQGVRPWVKPWHDGRRDALSLVPRRHNGERYQGINIVTLWTESITKGFGTFTWMTFKQAQALGGCVRKGEKGSLVVYASTMQRSEKD